MSQRRFLVWGALVSALMFHPINTFADDDGLDGLQERVERNTWIKIRDDRRANITAWYKIEDGKSVRSFKLEALMDSSLEKIAKTILVADNFQHYFWECYESRQVQKISNTDLYAYLKVNVPKPVPDRDIVMHLHVTPYSKKRGYLLFDIKAAPGVLALVPGLVRVPEYTFVVKLTPLGSDETKLEMVGSINPGGDIPAWAINFIMRNAPYTSILGMRRLAKLSDKRFEEPFPYRVIED